jgi:hypothetical protein
MTWWCDEPQRGLPFVLVGVVLVMGVSRFVRKGRLSFVAPPDVQLSVTIDESWTRTGKGVDGDAEAGRSHRAVAVEPFDPSWREVK